MKIQVDSDFFCDLVRIIRFTNVERWKLSPDNRRKIKLEETIQRLEKEYCNGQQ